MEAWMVGWLVCSCMFVCWSDGWMVGLMVGCVQLCRFKFGTADNDYIQEHEKKGSIAFEE